MSVIFVTELPGLLLLDSDVNVGDGYIEVRPRFTSTEDITHLIITACQTNTNHCQSVNSTGFILAPIRLPLKDTTRFNLTVQAYANNILLQSTEKSFKLDSETKETPKGNGALTLTTLNYFCFCFETKGVFNLKSSYMS